MPTERKLVEAFASRRRTKEANREDLEKRFKRALEDVLESEISIAKAAINRKVPAERLRLAVLEKRKGGAA